MRTAEYPVRSRLSGIGPAADSLVLTGGWVALDSSTARRADLEIVNGRISRLAGQNGSECHTKRTNAKGPSTEISVEGCLILPGLVNAHDHLEFNLFPRLGRGPYPNFEDWANDIFHPDCSPVREHLCVPKHVRLWWGGLKNLLSGVTTVCHHNRYDERVFEDDFPVRVVKRYGWAHSIRFCADLRRAFSSTLPNTPFLIHLGEGTDRRSQREIFDLRTLGALDSKTVVVHGVALTSQGHTLRRRRGAALVWCPTSNRFTLGKTLDAASFSEVDRVALGSDSALTAEGDLLNEIRAAGKEGANPCRIYSMVTESGADVLRLENGEGTLRPGTVADLAVVRRQGTTPAETLVKTRLETIEMVMVSGVPQLVSGRMFRRCPPELLDGFEKIEVEDASRFVRAPVGRLLKEARKCLGGDVRLAGKRVTA